MKYIELSLENLQKESNRLAKIIEKSYKPDLVVFVASAGYLIGKTISEYFNIPLIAIGTERKGNSFKSLFQPLLCMIPLKIRLFLRNVELKSNIHKTLDKRNVSILSDLTNIKLNSINNIIIVDDSIDTGKTIAEIVRIVETHFKSAMIKTSALNIMSESIQIIKSDYWLYEDTILITPMSKDSKEYNVFKEYYTSYFESLGI